MYLKLEKYKFEIDQLERYLKDLRSWENDPNRNDEHIYQRLFNEN